MAGSVRSTFATRVMHSAADEAKGDEIVVAPSLLPFNTDTQHYWRLSKSIWRYNHISPDDFYSKTSLHSVNEALRATAFVETIRAFGTIIANGDELPFTL
jgi:Gly-Xaa carboxypeptidase